MKQTAVVEMKAEEVANEAARVENEEELNRAHEDLLKHEEETTGPPVLASGKPNTEKKSLFRGGFRARALALPPPVAAAKADPNPGRMVGFKVSRKNPSD